jgi:hypothetical protein
MQVNAKSISLDISGSSLISMNKLIDNVILLGQQQKLIKNIVMQQLSLDVKDNYYAVTIQADIQ